MIPAKFLGVVFLVATSVVPSPGQTTNQADQVQSSSTNAAPGTMAPLSPTNAVPWTAEVSAPPVTNASPAAAAAPAENPAAVAEAAASTEAMIQDFRSLGRDGEESEQEEAWTRVKVPGFVRVLAWAGFFMLFVGEVWLIGMAIHQADSMTWALLILFFNPVAGFIYWIFHIRAAAVPYGIYAAGFLMLTIPMLHYRMGFFDLLM